jgi:hypothetical protein
MRKDKNGVGAISRNEKAWKLTTSGKLVGHIPQKVDSATFRIPVN